MSKLGRFFVFIVAVLIASAARPNNFRAADQVYLAAAGHLAGQSGTFISDVFISNVENEAIDVSVIFFPSGTGMSIGSRQDFARVLRLNANERRELKDFFANTLHISSGFGQLIFNACKANADCTPNPTTGTSPNFRNITVQSRIYSIPPGSNPVAAPTTGQLFSGVPWYANARNYLGSTGLDTVFITGLRNTGGLGEIGTYRSNIGLVNGSEFSTTTFTISLFTGTGSAIGAPAQVTLGPLGHTQQNINVLFPTFVGTGATNAYAVIAQGAIVPTSNAAANGCSNGCPAFLAYGSLLDNTTGDATTLEGQFRKPLSDAAIDCLFAVCKTDVPIRRSVNP